MNNEIFLSFCLQNAQFTSLQQNQIVDTEKPW